MAAKTVHPGAASIGGRTTIARGEQHDLDTVDRVYRRNSAAGSERQTVVIVVEPVGRGRFRSKVDGRVIVESSRQPFVDSARVLIGEACDPAVRLVMRHRGSPSDALVAEVGAAAKLVIREDRGAPEFVSYRQMPRKLDAGSPRIAPNEPPATPMGPEANVPPRWPRDASEDAP
jgi:hypothetical protein